MGIILYAETLPGGQRYDILKIADDRSLNNTSEYIVREGTAFVLGDSRLLNEVGLVPIGNVNGVPTFIFYAPDFSRIGTAVRRASVRRRRCGAAEGW